MESERMLRPTVSYHLFLYRLELARRNARQLRLSRTKIEITDELISKTVRNIIYFWMKSEVFPNHKNLNI